MNMMLGISLAATNANSGGAAPTVIYYVDPAGSDAANGLSPATAWQTLSKVNGATIPAGASVLFKGGSTFTGSLNLVEARHYGSSGLITKYGSYGTGRATINTTTSTNYGIYAIDPKYVTIENLIVTGVGRTTSTASGVFLEVLKLASTRLPAVTLSNVDVSGFGDCGILAWSHPSDNSPSGFDDLTLLNCLVHDCCTTGNGIFMVSNAYGLKNLAPTFKRTIIRSCKVYDNPGGYASPTSHSGSGILLAQTDGALVESCEAYNNGAGNTYAQGPVGIWFYDTTNSIIQFCESHHNKTGLGTSDGDGFDLDGGCQNCTVQYCYSHDNYGQGYQLYQYNDPTNILSLTGNTIRYCISENDCQQNTATKGAFLLGSADNTRACSGNAIYGCAVFNSTASANAVYIFSNPNQFTTSYVGNNIFYLTGASSKFILSSTSTAPALLFIGNCYSSPATSIKWGATTYTTFSNWRAAFPTQETVAGGATFKAANPSLVGTVPVGTIGGFDPLLLGAYKTQAASVCKNGGQDLNALYGISMGSRDLFGNPIPQGLYDIGCYETA